jgi:predicted PurR-regulated permease PerM
MGDQEISVEGNAAPGAAAEPTESLRSRSHWALNLLGIGIVLGICYFAEMVLVVAFISVLLAFVLAPIADGLTNLRVPRPLASAVAVLVFLSVIGGTVFYSSNQAAGLARDLPKYVNRVRDELTKLREKAESLQVLGPQHETGIVNVRSTPNWTEILTRGFGSVSEAILAASFVPFLTYFMLTWQQHVRSATVMLFPMKNRHAAYVTLGLISAMIRSFMVGNLLLGLLIGTVSTLFFWVFHVPFFYIVGFISGFLSLVPYMGVLLALALPIFVSLGHLESLNVIGLVVVVLGLHAIVMNVLYPKFLGKRLRLNPLAVSLALLLWVWLWGGLGLLLAIPITAATKIVFDHVESLKPYGDWLGE